MIPVYVETRARLPWTDVWGFARRSHEGALVWPRRASVGSHCRAVRNVTPMMCAASGSLIRGPS